MNIENFNNNVSLLDKYLNKEEFIKGKLNNSDINKILNINRFFYFRESPEEYNYIRYHNKKLKIIIIIYSIDDDYYIVRVISKNNYQFDYRLDQINELLIFLKKLFRNSL